MSSQHLDVDKLALIIFGASGDLAKKKTFPALYQLFRKGYISANNAVIIGYARSHLSIEEFHGRLASYLMPNNNGHVAEDDQTVSAFLKICHYQEGSYTESSGYEKLKTRVLELEKSLSSSNSNEGKLLRLFYLALPPSIFLDASTGIKKYLVDSSFSSRLIVEKPFGHDVQSSAALSANMAKLFDESQIFRIDHYLGKEMVKNVLLLRFANMFFKAIWNKECIANIQVTFKEKIGVNGRGGYFDSYGIIRDVMQNHLLQILTLIAMEEPKSLNAEDIRDTKVQVLREIEDIDPDQVIIGQYIKSVDGTLPGYTDDSTVQPGSLTPTYTALVLYINNARWRGVPFILKCGKALDDAKTEVRIQFKDVDAGGASVFGGPTVAAQLASQQGQKVYKLESSSSSSFFDEGRDLPRNELVIRVSPVEAVYLKLNVKRPGLSIDTIQTALDLTYHERFDDLYIPDAYESLLLDALNGDHANFVRTDELDLSWKIFTPLLHKIEQEKWMPFKYPRGSRGPSQVDELVANVAGYRRASLATWRPSNN